MNGFADGNALEARRLYEYCFPNTNTPHSSNDFKHPRSLWKREVSNYRLNTEYLVISIIYSVQIFNPVNIHVVNINVINNFLSLLPLTSILNAWELHNIFKQIPWHIQITYCIIMAPLFTICLQLTLLIPIESKPLL